MSMGRGALSCFSASSIRKRWRSGGRYAFDASGGAAESQARCVATAVCRHSRRRDAIESIVISAYCISARGQKHLDSHPPQQGCLGLSVSAAPSIPALGSEHGFRCEVVVRPRCLRCSCTPDEAGWLSARNNPSSARRQDGHGDARHAGQLARVVDHVDLPDLRGAANVHRARSAGLPAAGGGADGGWR